VSPCSVSFVEMNQSLRRWLLAALFWIALGAVSVGMSANLPGESGQAITWAFAIQAQSLSIAFWLPISVAVMALVRRFPTGRSNWIQSVSLLVVTVVAITLGRAVFVVVVNPFGIDLPAFVEVVKWSMRSNLLIALMVVGIAHAVVYFEREEQAELKLAQLESRLASAQLESLSAQLNPHFLFNALNSIAELVHHDAVAADRMLVSLSSLLRRSLDALPAQIALLSEELKLLRHYLEIEKVRLGERLQIDWQVDSKCLQALVPVLILQPIVENAIVHAIAKRSAPGQLRVCIEREQEQLVMRVSDSGFGQSVAASAEASGIGLSNTRGRLLNLYGAAHAVVLTQNDTGGTTVTVRLPYRTDPTKISNEEWLHEPVARSDR